MVELAVIVSLTVAQVMDTCFTYVHISQKTAADSVVVFSCEATVIYHHQLLHRHIEQAQEASFI